MMWMESGGGSDWPYWASRECVLAENLGTVLDSCVMNDDTVSGGRFRASTMSRRHCSVWSGDRSSWSRRNSSGGGNSDVVRGRRLGWEVLRVGGDHNCGTTSHCSRQHVSIFRIVRHGRDERLVVGDLDVRELPTHHVYAAPSFGLGHRVAELWQSALRLVQNLVSTTAVGRCVFPSTAAAHQ